MYDYWMWTVGLVCSINGLILSQRYRIRQKEWWIWTIIFAIGSMLMSQWILNRLGGY